MKKVRGNTKVKLYMQGKYVKTDQFMNIEKLTNGDFKVEKVEDK